MNRRETVLALVAIGAAPLTSFAQQQGKVWRIGILLVSGDSRRISGLVDEFKRAMNELGYLEGKNVHYERRFGESKYDTLPALADDLVRLNVDLILAQSTPASRAAQRATRTIPIVMVTGVDPVGTGLVASLARPGGNITGMSNRGSDLTPKLLELLLATTGKLSRVAILANPDAPATNSMLDALRTAARKFNVTLLVAEAKTPEDVERVLPKVKRERAQAMVVLTDSFFTSNMRQIAAIALKLRLPIASFSETAEAGGLISYGPPIHDQYRRAASFVDKILRGAKPADLPVEQVTRIELVLNLKTAKTLGLKIPQSVLQRADRVIE